MTRMAQRNVACMSRIAACLAIALVAIPPVAGPAPLAIGETFTIASKVARRDAADQRLPAARLRRDRRRRRLPVLYMPDGGMAEDFLHVAGLVQVSVGNGTMRPFVLVGHREHRAAPRHDRARPTNAEDRKIAPRVGGSAAFRDVHPHELMPRGDGALPHDRRRRRSSASRSPGCSSSRRSSSSRTCSTPTSRSIRASGGTTAGWSRAPRGGCRISGSGRRRCISPAAAKRSSPV